ncbi:monovalent cation/H+ antiporter subunit E [Corynebacterium mendelii]|uniref:Monovalent cation/H+ antiporter subunit E n=1 Tax=Corynebacterium mendelii TaxID=2765362 RepID=A0A939E0T9_9CORY|nr:monovalent cation/H+ antiporter subunit E [Corynebacterium mendelii]MBN9643758.1 monovalent cation/H+ antiporter subunit E [Corynebacterium mendelii]
MFNAITYLFWLIGQVFAGAIAIAVDICRKETKMEPVMVEYPLRVTKDWQIAAFTTSITMTPGTLSCGTIPPDNEGEPTILLVQAVYGHDPAEVIAGLADMEQRLAPSIADVDHGAPGQGSGDPLRSTIVAGHSDDQIGPTETDGHHVRTEDEMPRSARSAAQATGDTESTDRLPGDLGDVYSQSTPTGRSLTENTGPFDSDDTITGHAAAIAGTSRHSLPDTIGTGNPPLGPGTDPLAEVHDPEPDVDGTSPETTPTDEKESR